MSPWFGYAIFVLGHTAGGVIRLRHERRSKLVPVAESRKGIVEVFLLALLTIAILLPLLAMATSLLSFANYAPCLACVVPGAVFMGLYVWLLYRSHADLGDNWSFTLQVRRDHRLVTSGIYGSIRHPMYAALYMLAIAQTLLVPNYVAGPATIAAFTATVLLRVGAEEQMMIDRFGDAYRAYAARTKRLIPGIW